jgi:uncharacterized membrane protein YsdA (DUF1294 family)
MPTQVVAAGALLVLWNVATWAVYRVDKARARRRARRVSERALLTMAALGGSPGALVAVYAHRQRHKARKRGFVAPLWLITAAHAALVAWALWARGGA